MTAGMERVRREYKHFRKANKRGGVQSYTCKEVGCNGLARLIPSGNRDEVSFEESMLDHHHEDYVDPLLQTEKVVFGMSIGQKDLCRTVYQQGRRTVGTVLQR